VQAAGGGAVHVVVELETDGVGGGVVHGGDEASGVVDVSRRRLDVHVVAVLAGAFGVVVAGAGADGSAGGGVVEPFPLEVVVQVVVPAAQVFAFEVARKRRSRIGRWKRQFVLRWRVLRLFFL
jgi:hypothetical protein